MSALLRGPLALWGDGVSFAGHVLCLQGFAGVHGADRGMEQRRRLVPDARAVRTHSGAKWVAGGQAQPAPAVETTCPVREAPCKDQELKPFGVRQRDLGAGLPFFEHHALVRAFEQDGR